MSSAIQVKWLWYNDYVKTQPTPSDHLFYFFLSGCYNSDTAAKKISKGNDVRVKSPTKTTTDHHNGDFKFRVSPSVILLVNIRCLQ